MNKNVLLLNASYTPLRVINWKRAITLVVEGRADVVENSDQIAHSPSINMEIPEVIRLKKYVKVPYKKKIPVTNKGVLKRDNHTCGYCGKKATTIDHIRPRSKGGKHSWLNVVAACVKCNSTKSDTQLSDLGWKLNIKPFEPEGDNWLVYGLKNNEKWEAYIP